MRALGVPPGAMHGVRPGRHLHGGRNECIRRLQWMPAPHAMPQA
jgi:hypothetical protein